MISIFNKSALFYICVITALALIALPAQLAMAQNASGALLRALDEPVTLNIPDTAINLALGRIASQSGLVIVLSDRASELLPYGEDTRVSINARQSPLGEVLTALLRPMCLSWSLKEQEIVITPNEYLLRTGRRPSFAESTTLAKLLTAEITAETPVLDQLRAGSENEKLTISWPQSYSDSLIRSHAIKAAERQLPCTAGEYLDAMCEGRSLTWLLSGNEIVIISETEHVQRMLGRVVSIDYRNRSLIDVLNDLASKAAVKLKMTPGVLKEIDPQSLKSFTLLIEKASIADAFEAITGATGLVFTPHGGGLKVSMASELPEKSINAPKTADFLLVVDVEGAAGEHYQMLIRPDELPESVAEELAKRKKILITELSKRYGKTSQIPTKSVGKE